MGDLLSTPETNPSDKQKGIDMSSCKTSKTIESNPEDGVHEIKTLETQTPVQDSEGYQEGEGEEEEEEEGECGFCLFMKGGGCKDSFIAWEKCIEEAEKNKEDIVEKCFEVTGMLKKCMEAHSDYYGPILQAEKAVEEEAVRELEKEKEADSLPSSLGTSEPNSAEKASEEQVSKGS